MRLGIIGAGQIGAMLATAWISANWTTPLVINTRTRAKATALVRKFPGRLQIMDSQDELAGACDAIFLCTKASDAHSIIEQIAPSLRANQWLAVTNSTTSLAWMEQTAPCRMAKIIPSMTQYARAGIVLVMPGERLQRDGLDEFYDLIAHIGTPHMIHEQEVRIYSDLTSCGPAFLADWLESMVCAAGERGVPEMTARFLVGEMVYGVGQLIVREHFTLSEIIDRISVPGGVTNAGLHVLRDARRDLFHRVFAATAAHAQSHAGETAKPDGHETAKPDGHETG